jgi:hypothetical protein
MHPLNNIKKNLILVPIGILMFFAIAHFLKNFDNRVIEHMTVVVKASVPQDDTFQLFYWTEDETKFKIVNSVRAKIKGRPDFQEIVFELPKMEDLFRLRLDIGENLGQGAVAISEIRFKKESNDYVFDAREFEQMFAPNKYISKNASGNFVGIPDTLEKKVIYDPYFISIDNSREMALIKTNRLTPYPYWISAFLCLTMFLFLQYNFKWNSLHAESAFMAIFMLILILPTLQNWIHFAKPMESMEKRELAKLPEFSWTKDYARQFETYYNDNFGLRTYLVNWGGAYKTKLFRSSMHPEKVMLGKNKWLYYNNFKSKIFDSYRRVNLLDKDSLALLAHQWEDNKKRFEAEGRKYFLAFWPNKHTIYPEFLPATMSVQIKDTVSRVDQIIDYLKVHNSSVTLIDVRPSLLESKTTHQLYHKFDTHWNDYGAFLAYGTFFENVRNELGIAPKAASDFDIIWEDYFGGDLIQMLGVQNNGFFKEKNPKFKLKENSDQIEYLSIEGYPKLTIRTRNKYAGNTLKALIFRDSFSNGLIQFFSLNFYEVTYIWGHKEYYVKKVQPDVIIDGFVEREIGEKHTLN